MTTKTKTTKRKRTTQTGKLIRLLKRRHGASIDELTNALGCQPHTIRAMISTQARRKAGLKVEVHDGRYINV